MSGVLAILRRELLSWFFSPLAWILLTLFLLFQGYSFFIFMELMNQPYAPHGAVMQYFFGRSFFYWLFMIFIVSALTMRLLAEERRLGTIEALMTAPITEAQVVIGKFLATLFCYLNLWLPTVAYVVIVAQLSDPPGIDWGPIAAGYLGTLVIGAACIAVGLLASALAKSQIVAAMTTFCALSLLLLIGVLELFISQPALKALIQHLNLFEQMDDFARGIVDSRHLVFHLSLILFCLTAAVKALEAKKRR